MPIIAKFYGIVLKMYFRQKEQQLVKRFIKYYTARLIKMWES